MKKIFLILLLFSAGYTLRAQEVWTIGPMLQINFGGEKRTASFAIEAAYWNLNHFPYSVDAAIEFDKGKIRFYSELQTGIGLIGLSAGPVFEINKKQSSAHFGFQTTFWANYFLGVDARLRWIDGTKYKCIGVYGKLPIAHNGLDESDGDSLDDWDWDD